MDAVPAGLANALQDRYRLDRELGEGGMATVYLAHDLKYDRQVAIKVLREDLARLVGPQRFLREIQLTAQLHYPHILPVFDSGEIPAERIEDAPRLWYATPLVGGGSLRDLLDRSGRLPLSETIRVLRGVAGALAHAHDRGIVHRDVKPENILLEDGEPLLADFGVARPTLGTGQATLTGIGVRVGTLGYMAPEQLTGEYDVDGRADLYSLGVVAFEMLAGRHPFAQVTHQFWEEAPSIRAVAPEIPESIDLAIRRALAVAPADRYATVRQFMEAIDSGAAAVGRMPSRSVPRRTLIAAGAGALLVAAAVLGWRAVRTRLPGTNGHPVALAIFPFRSLGPEAGSLGEGVADLLAAAVDGAGGMRVADPSGLWRHLPREADRIRAPDLSEAMALAHGVSAPTLVLGTLTAAAGRLDITARVYSGSGALRATVAASAPAESLAQAVNRLALDMVGLIWQRESLPTVPVIENLATQSIDAMKAYLAGKSLKRQGRFPEAEERLEQAVTLDSTFALAQMELANVRSWTLWLSVRPFTGLGEIIDRAMRYRDRLSQRNRLRVEAMGALNENDGLRAASLVEQILALDSLDTDARQMLATTYLFLGWQVRKGIDDIIAAYDRVLAADPGSVVARATRVWVGLVRDDTDAVRQGLVQLTALDTALPYIRGQLIALRALDAEGARRDSVLRVAASEAIPVVVTAFRTLRMNRPQVAERLLDELTADSMSTLHQRIGSGARVQLWFGEGRLRGTDSVLATGKLDFIRPVIERYFVISALAGAGDTALARRALGRLTPQPPSDAVAARLDSVPSGMSVVWAAAAYHATFGDTALARRWIRLLGILSPGNGMRDPRPSLIADLESRLAARRGDQATSEAEARRAYELWGDHSSYALEAEPEPAMRWRLAELLRARGLLEEAVPLYQSLCPPYTWVGFYTALSGLALGEIEEGRRHPREAARYYGTAIRLWERGEPAVVGAWLVRAQEGLRRVAQVE